MRRPHLRRRVVRNPQAGGGSAHLFRPSGARVALPAPLRAASSLALVLAACTHLPGLGPPPPCVTTCGLYTSVPVDCAGLAATEAAGVAALGRGVAALDGGPAWTPEAVCAAQRGVHVVVVATDGGSWVDGYGRRVAGEYVRDFRAIELGTQDWPRSALVHEMAHVCEDRIDHRVPAVDHSDWTERGVWRAIEAARAAQVRIRRSARTHDSSP